MSALSRTDTQLQPLLGVTPLGPMQLSQEKVYQLKMLEASCKHMPLPADSERVRYIATKSLAFVTMTSRKNNLKHFKRKIYSLGEVEPVTLWA